jgi:hypothetical protein
MLTTTEQSRTRKSVAAPAITLAASARGSPTIPPGTQKRISARDLFVPMVWTMIVNKAP